MKALNTKILLAILALLLVLVGFGAYFYNEKQKEEAAKLAEHKFLYGDSGIDVSKIFGKNKKEPQNKQKKEKEGVNLSEIFGKDKKEIPENKQ